MKKIVVVLSIIFLFNAVFLFQLFFARNQTIITQQQILLNNNLPVYSYKIYKTYPHDTDNFTEGLVLNQNILYESNGLYHQSHIDKIDFKSQQTIQRLKLNHHYFSEGITIFHNQLYQLTYQSHIGFIYNPQSLQLLKTFYIPTQGWGLTHDSHSLIMSNGSSTLYYLDPMTLKITKSADVKMGIKHIGYINALAYIHKKIYANIWKTNLIAVISPITGQVQAWINLTGLNPDPKTLTGDFVLNGITYRPKVNHLIVTGKCWPTLYEIKIIKGS